ncbi:hypothetical protein [Streptomyces sp. NPDC093109]|uniref:hypothetical protein n=1 Tax=Streptomyces sp. NPDC093109 TaxID=3154977 RepID=UPI00344E601B
MEAAAELAVESACHLADAVTSTAWSEAVAEDALDTIEILTTALSQIGPETAKALAAVAAATTAACRQLGLPVGPGPGLDGMKPALPVPRTGQQPAAGVSPRQRPRRRLGPGFQGIRMER